MRKIEQNFKKHPHTARWLMAFHTGGQGLAAELTGEREPESYSGDGADLLDLVPETTDVRTAGQVKFMDDLIRDITELDAELGLAARDWTDKATAAGHWTAGFGGTASKWIDRMKFKRQELRAAARQVQPVTAAPATQVPDGRYAVEEDGVLKFFKVKNGRHAGHVFLDVQASDDWHKISSVTRIRRVVALIAADAEEASLRYGRELGICGDCGRTLTDETSRTRGRGPICDAKH